MFERIYKNSAFQGVSLFFIILGIIIAILAASFVVFTLGYWLITLILDCFFAFTLPFSWWYSLGAWLIYLIITVFMLPSGLFKSKNKD